MRNPKRAFTRFKSEPRTLAYVEVHPLPTGEFAADHIGLVYEEAFKGCGLVTLSTKELKTGDRVRVKVGEMEPVVAEVRWRIDLDPTTIKIGLHYQD